MIAKKSVITLSTVKNKDIAKSNEYQSSKSSSSHETFMAKRSVWSEVLFSIISHCTPGPHLMRIHLVWYSTSARYEKYSIIHLVRPIIHLVRIFALSTSWIN